MGRLLAFGLGLLVVAAVIEQLRRQAADRTWEGAVMGVPYDFRPPTLRRLRNRCWNPDDPRVFTPHVFGVGWSLNLYQVWRRLEATSTASG